MKFRINENLKVAVASIIALILSAVLFSVCASLGRSCNIAIINNNIVLNTLLEVFILLGQIIVLKLFGKDKSILNDLGLKDTSNAFKHIVIGIVITSMYIFLSYFIVCLMKVVDFKGIGYNFYSSDVVNFSIYNAFMLSIFAGVCEEVLFRGVLCNYLNRFKGPVLAVVVSAAVFAIAHTSLNYDIRDLVVIFFYGLALGYFFIKTKSLYLCMAVHFMIDFIEYFIGLDGVGLLVFKRCSDISTELFNNAGFFSSMAAYAVFVILFIIGKKFIKNYH